VACFVGVVIIGEQRGHHTGRQLADIFGINLAHELPARRQLDEDEAGWRVDEDGVVGQDLGHRLGLRHRRSGGEQGGSDQRHE